MTKPSQERGFTLLEMVVVVAVLVLLAALLVPKLEFGRENADATVARAALNTVREAFVGSASAPGYIADMKTLPDFPLTDIKLSDLLQKRSGFPGYDPIARRGWRGPYLDNVQPVLNTNVARNGLFPAATEQRSSGDPTFLARKFYDTPAHSFYGIIEDSGAGIIGDRAAADPWGNPMVIQIPPGVDAAERFHHARVVSAGHDGFLETPRDDHSAGMLPDGTTKARGDDLVIFLNRADIYEP